MLSAHLTALLALTTLSSASTLPAARRGSSILRLPVTTVNQTSHQVLKRQDVVSLANVETGTRYLISFSIGSPPQTATVAIDTGSSDTWVNPTCSTAETPADVSLCNSIPPFQSGSSTTLKDTGIAMDLSYGIGSAEGEYFKDNFVLGGATVTAQQFGIASSSEELPTGFMGVGPGIELIKYPNIIDTLASQGVTQSRAFSLDLRGVDSPTGSVIFGGIDTMKYTGALEKRPIIPAADAPDNFDRYWIYMSSVGITKPGEAPKTYPPPSNPSGQPVFLDSGGTLSRLPTPIFNAILADFPSATADPSNNGIYEVPCSVASQDGTMDFGFGSTVIHVPFHEFIWEADTNLCVLGVVADDDAPVLGDSFLRAAFVVYDQDNQNLHVANAADCGTNLVAISKGVNAVPSITGACGGSSTSTSSSSTAPTTTSSPPTTGKSSPSTSSTGGHFTNSTYLPSSTLSTVYTTTTYTVSSCAPTVTNCPYGHLTTETISLYTTYCPVTGGAKPTSTPALTTYAPYNTVPYNTVAYVTTTYTISSCAATVKYCPYGSTTTETYATTIGGAKSSYTAVSGVYANVTTSAKAEQFTGGASKNAGGFGMLILGGLAAVALL